MLSAVIPLLLFAAIASAQSFNSTELPGVVVDDTRAKLVGDWTKSTSVRPFVDEGYIHAKGPGASATFMLKAPTDGPHHVRIAYTPGGNREAEVPVAVEAAGRMHPFKYDQRHPGKNGWCFHDLGRFDLKKGEPVKVTISTDGTSDYVIVDAVQLLTPGELQKALAMPAKPAPSPTQPKVEAKPEPESAEPFMRTPPTHPLRTLPLDELESMLAPHLGDAQPIGDDLFLRRATLDLIGRPPTAEELQAFRADEAKDKRGRAIDRLLDSSEFGRNWANYWSDVIGYRQQQPELTFHDYGPFRGWLAEQLNSGEGWDAIVYRMITASGKVGQNPAATFVGFHQGNANRLAGETTRVFMSVQIACAECHDHPFLPDLKQEMFHGIAAFFARTDAKIPQLNSDGIEVKARDKGEHKGPGRIGTIEPTTLAGDALELGAADADRRQALAHWVVSGDNIYFALAHVNRVWARLMGRGFVEPIDDIGQGVEADRVLPEVFDALASHFAASGFDTRDLFRLIMNTRAYQRSLSRDAVSDAAWMTKAAPKPLRSDEVFASLATGVALPNVTPERQKKTGAVRFPPPPKSTRDLVDDAFGFDPSFSDENVPRTIKQAMFMMNNRQLQAQIDASPGSGTILAKLLAEDADDAAAVTRLFERVLARKPTDRERDILVAYIAEADDRGEAFEDVLWSLINTAEFTTRR